MKSVKLSLALLALTLNVYGQSSAAQLLVSQKISGNTATIAFDASADGGLVNTGTSLTWSHTTSGSNRILFVGVFGDTLLDFITGVTYNSASMTLVTSYLVTGDRWIYLFYLVNPASGTHNVVVSASNSIVIGAQSSSYTGAKQSGQPDNSTTKMDSTTTLTSFTTNLTPVADNSWTLLFSKNSVGAASAGTGSTLRQSSANGDGMFDSNGPIHPAASYGMTITSGPAANWGTIMASIAPL